MTDEHPLPAERALSDQARARHRAALLEAAQQDRRPRRPWLVPTLAAVAAAAAVATVAVGSAVLDDDGSTAPAQPAGSGGPPPSHLVPDGTPETVPSEGATRIPRDQVEGLPGGTPEAEPCDTLRLPVRGAEELTSFEIGETTVRVYSNGEQAVVCDEWAAITDGGVATVLRPHPAAAPLAAAQFAVSMNFSMNDPKVAEYVAGGLVPDDVSAIRYTFPDGHVEEAVVDDGAWAMAYFARTGPMSGGGRLTPGEATVEVVRPGGSETFTLSFPEDFCAQTNHGC